VKRRLAGAVTLLFALTLVSAGAIATATPASAPSVLTPDQFVPIGPVTAPMAAADTATPGPTPELDAVSDFRLEPRSFDPRPAPDTAVAPRVVVVPTAPPKPRAAPAARSTSSGTSGGANRVSGSASWYCMAGTSACHYQYSGGMYAAAGPALRVGDWRGRTVRVCGNGSCVSVKLIDWCACPSSGRIIDLYSDAFRQLAPLSSGTLRVTISW
jgi:hypothetical protein